MKLSRYPLRGALTCLALAGLNSLALAQDVKGAGATFPAPLYAKWADAYQKASGLRIDYQPVGSGAGIKQIKAKRVDFGATDTPLDELELSKDQLLQIPIVVGGIVPVVNIQGVAPGQMKITGAVLGDIYLGKIKKWNDPALLALNPGVSLPDSAIAVVRRSDGSGTTALFTNYLAKVSPEWKATAGEGSVITWPTGAGGRGNEGVATLVQQVPHSIGYVEYALALQNKMSFLLMKNQAGAFVAPSPTAFKAAAAAADWSKNMRRSLTEQPGKDSWPITGATYILVHMAQDKAAETSKSLKFFDWAFTYGDKTASELGYVPLPDNAKQLIRQQWADRIKPVNR